MVFPKNDLHPVIHHSSATATTIRGTERVNYQLQLDVVAADKLARRAAASLSGQLQVGALIVTITRRTAVRR